MHPTTERQIFGTFQPYSGLHPKVGFGRRALGRCAARMTVVRKQPLMTIYQIAVPRDHCRNVTYAYPKANSASCFYVAVMRAKRSVAIVLDKAGMPSLHIWMPVVVTEEGMVPRGYLEPPFQQKVRYSLLKATMSCSNNVQIYE